MKEYYLSRCMIFLFFLTHSPTESIMYQENFIEMEQIMKKAIHILIPTILILAIIACIGWYLFIYDREFTRDVLLYSARHFERSGDHAVSAWFYDLAYEQAGDNDAVAIELAEQHKKSGNYTKAEYTLSKAIADGGGAELYIALCKTYVEQDKLLDAVNMLNNVANPEVKNRLEALRPKAPTCSPDPISTGAYYTQYITVSISSDSGTLYVNQNGEFPSLKTDLYENGITLADGENIIYAVAVADNGLVSPASIFGFTVGGVIEQITFVDTAVEAAIREKLAVSADKTLYSNDLWTITEFTVPTQAKNLEDLSHLVFLEKLSMHQCVAEQLTFIPKLSLLKELHISDTAVSAEELLLIGNLPNLQKLTLSNCSLSTTAGLEKAVGLTYLDLSNNTIRNITPLESLTALQELNLQYNALNDLTALASITGLTQLDVSYNILPTLSTIRTLSSLKHLQADNNVLTDISSVGLLTALEYLSLSHNSVTDLSALTGCAKLSYLDVSNNELIDISALSKLNTLTNLYFANNQVTALPVWSNDCGLINIDGSHNNISSLEPLAGLKHLNNVFMDYNPEIESVKELASCPVLIQVNVFGTKVTEVNALTDQSILVNFNPTQ